MPWIGPVVSVSSHFSDLACWLRQGSEFLYGVPYGGNRTRSFTSAGFRVPKPRFVILVVAILLVPLLWRGGPNGFAMTVAGVTLVAVLFASLLQLVIEQAASSTAGLRMLRSPILTRLGKYSYAIYLFHILFLTEAVQLRDNRSWAATQLFAGG